MTDPHPGGIVPAAGGGLLPTPPAPSLAHLLQWRVQATGSRPAYRYRDGRGEWRTESWAQCAPRAHEFAAALIDMGLRPGECVALASSTRYEWMWCDLGVLSAAGVTTSIYPTSLAAMSRTSCATPAPASSSPRDPPRSTCCATCAVRCRT